MAEPTRFDFELPDEDAEYLRSLGLEWSTIEETGIKAVVMRGYTLPAAFVPRVVDVHVRLPADYKTGAALDMFYTAPRVARLDGQAIPNYTDTALMFGTIWQQWSRHRNTQQWRPGEDSLATHMAYMTMALKKEAGE